MNFLFFLKEFCLLNVSTLLLFVIKTFTPFTFKTLNYKYNIYIMETEQCDICGRKCDGVHSNKINTKEKEIQKIVNVLESYGEKVVDEVIKKIYENRRLKCKNL
jgi:hypothetical protein